MPASTPGHSAEPQPPGMAPPPRLAAQQTSLPLGLGALTPAAPQHSGMPRAAPAAHGAAAPQRPASAAAAMHSVAQLAAAATLRAAADAGRQIAQNLAAATVPAAQEPLPGIANRQTSPAAASNAAQHGVPQCEGAAGSAADTRSGVPQPQMDPGTRQPSGNAAAADALPQPDAQAAGVVQTQGAAIAADAPAGKGELTHVAVAVGAEDEIMMDEQDMDSFLMELHAGQA